MLFSRRPSLRVIFVVVLVLVSLHYVFFGARIPRPVSDRFSDFSWSKSHDAPAPPGHHGTIPHGEDKSSTVAPGEAAPGEDEKVFKSEPHKADTSPSTSSSASAAATTTSAVSKPSKSKLACATADGMEDIVLIIKTGATEAEERLPVHFNTTMHCFPNVLIFSDYGETMEGHTIHDALADVTPEIRLGDKDFELWRRLHEKGRADLKPEELSTAHKLADPNSGTGNVESGGWRLDKFKNMPMLGKTLALKPDAKWYIFTDADTFISWSNLITWTKKLDHTKKLYLGSAAVIGEQVFGHGGSGYILSAPAMKAGADLYAEKQDNWDRFASSHWAGDCVLATALDKDLDIKLTWSFPMIQGGDPTVMDFGEIGYDKKLWCFPAVSYHHLAPSTIESMWEFEQEWTSREEWKKADPMLHGDVFKQWLLPQLDKKEWSDWDNHAKDVLEEVDINDNHGCRAICEGNSTCLQYSFGNGTCKTFDKVMLGAKATEKTEGTSSGWMIKKINGFVSDWDKCNGGEQEGKWIMP